MNCLINYLFSGIFFWLFCWLTDFSVFLVDLSISFIISISVADPDPFHFGQPDPDPFHEKDPGSKKSTEIMENFHKKIYQNQKNIMFFFFKNNKLMFNGHKYLPHK